MLSPFGMADAETTRSPSPGTADHGPGAAQASAEAATTADAAAALQAHSGCSTAAAQAEAATTANAAAALQAHSGCSTAAAQATISTLAAIAALPPLNPSTPPAAPAAADGDWSVVTQAAESPATDANAVPIPPLEAAAWPPLGPAVAAKNKRATSRAAGREAAPTTPTADAAAALPAASTPLAAAAAEQQQEGAPTTPTADAAAALPAASTPLAAAAEEQQQVGCSAGGPGGSSGGSTPPVAQAAAPDAAVAAAPQEVDLDNMFMSAGAAACAATPPELAGTLGGTPVFHTKPRWAEDSTPEDVPTRPMPRQAATPAEARPCAYQDFRLKSTEFQDFKRWQENKEKAEEQQRQNAEAGRNARRAAAESADEAFNAWCLEQQRPAPAPISNAAASSAGTPNTQPPQGPAEGLEAYFAAQAAAHSQGKGKGKQPPWLSNPWTAQAWGVPWTDTWGGPWPATGKGMRYRDRTSDGRPAKKAYADQRPARDPTAVHGLRRRVRVQVPDGHRARLLHERAVHPQPGEQGGAPRGSSETRTFAGAEG